MNIKIQEMNNKIVIKINNKKLNKKELKKKITINLIIIIIRLTNKKFF